MIPPFPNLNDGGSVVRLAVLDVELPQLDAEQVTTWLSGVANSYGFVLSNLTYVFCSDGELHKMNIEHLDHDTLTDIITFDLSEEDDLVIDGECYISLDRVAENASSFGVTFDLELRRVLVHGLLHLCGFGDKSAGEERQMRAEEDRALATYDS